MALFFPTYWARGDSSSAGNNSLNVDGLNKVAAVQIQFAKTDDGVTPSAGGDLVLGPSSFIDGNTLISIDGGNWTAFTFEFSGYLGYDPKLLVNGCDLVGEHVAAITVTGGDRLFFFTEFDIDRTTIESMLPKEFGLDDAGESHDDSPVCFTKGVLIRCASGDVQVEKLKLGDIVVAVDGTLHEIKWIGKRSLTNAELKRKPHLAPVRIRAGAVCNNLPSSDLVVSQQHRMLLDNWQVELLFGTPTALAAAKHLVNDHSILIKTPEDGVEYYHILFDQHEIIHATDALSESFHPGQWALDRLGDKSRNEIFELFPELKTDASNYGPTAEMVLKSFEAKALSALN